MSDCIFCKIIQKTVPADFIHENEQIVVFKDIYPKAPVHLLIVPKQHLPSLAQVSEKDGPLLANMLLLLPQLAKQQGLGSGFKTMINTGIGGGQEIAHLHFHLMGGSVSTA